MADPFDSLPDEARSKLWRRRHPRWTAPMLATLTDDPFSDPDWVYERKLDGVRCLAFRNGRDVRLLSRNRKNRNDTYPELVDALGRQPREDFVVDGEFARRLARLVAARDPEHFTVEQRKDARGDRLFVDYLRNGYAQHGIAPYSVRARPGAPVATPLDRDELADSRLDPRRYTIRNLFRRLAQKEDPWTGIGRRASSLDRARRRLDELANEADGDPS